MARVYDFAYILINFKSGSIDQIKHQIELLDGEHIFFLSFNLAPSCFESAVYEPNAVGAKNGAKKKFQFLTFCPLNVSEACIDYAHSIFFSSRSFAQFE